MNTIKNLGNICGNIDKQIYDDYPKTIVHNMINNWTPAKKESYQLKG